MNSTTNINDLPTDPAGGGNSTGHVASLTGQGGQGGQGGSQMSLDQTTINQIISGLQMASATGATQLPSKDIPRTTETLTQDAQVQPNYVPPPPPQHMNYLDEQESTEDIIQEYNKRERSQNKMDEFYDEIQTPLMLVVLYFIFQLPVVRKTLARYLPMMFHTDGNFNINGYIMTSILFGGLYYVISKCMSQISRL
jgi:hypothetical protein